MHVKKCLLLHFLAQVANWNMYNSGKLKKVDRTVNTVQ